MPRVVVTTSPTSPALSGREPVGHGSGSNGDLTDGKGADSSAKHPMLANSWFRACVIANVVALAVLAMLMPTTHAAKLTPGDTVSESTDGESVVFIMFLVAIATALIELVFRIVLLNPYQFVRMPLNCLDVVALAGCVCAVVKPRVFPSGMALFRVFRATEIATDIWSLDGPKIVAMSLSYSPRTLMHLFVYLLFWTLFFALMGLEFYLGSLSRRCTVNGELTQPETWCGDTGSEDYWGSTRCKVNYGHVCSGVPPHPAYGNPYNGLAGFDSIGQSALIVATFGTLSDWATYLKALREAEYSVSMLYPIAVIVIQGLIAVNLFVAAVTFGFSRVCAAFPREQTEEQQIDPKLASAVVMPLPGGDDTISVQAAEPVSWDDNSGPEPSGIRARCGACLRSEAVERIVITSILINACLLASYHHDMSDAHRSIYFYGEIGFTSLYCFEAGLKLAAWGPREYFNDNWNCFDFAIVVASLVDLVVDVSSISHARILRLFRALRVSRAFRRFHAVQAILNSMADSAYMIAWAFLLLLFLQLTFALVMHQLYANRFNKYDPVPRATFDTILSSCLCLMQLITGDSWEHIMFNAMDDSDTGWAAAFCFITVYVIANFLVINLFVAAMLNSISASTIDTSEDDMVSRTSADVTGAEKQSCDPTNRAGVGVSIHNKETSLFEHDETHTPAASSQLLNHETVEGLIVINNKVPQLPQMQRMSEELDSPTASRSPSTSHKQLHDLASKQAGCLKADSGHDRSLGIFTADSAVRRICLAISDSKHFQGFMIAQVLLSNAILVLDSKENSGMYQYSGFRTAEFISTQYFTAVFSVEIVLNSIAYGFCCTGSSDELSAELAEEKQKKHVEVQTAPYLQQSLFNKLDLVAVLLAYAELFVKIVFPTYDGLRVGRVARPLRLLGRGCPEGVQNIVLAFADSLPLLMNTILVANMMWFCFAVAATSQFSGLLRWCNDSSASGQADCLGSYTDPETSVVSPRTWVSWWRNFDHLGKAYMTLYEVASTDMWSEVMYACIDATGEGQQPSKNHNPWAALFFTLFLFAGCFFMIQLFVTVVVDCHARLQAKEAGLLTQHQSEYHNIESIVMFNEPLALPKRPRSDQACGLRTFFYDLCVPWDPSGNQIDVMKDLHIYKFAKVHSCMWAIRHYFSRITLALIAINLGLMATRHTDMDADWEGVIQNSNRVVSGLFGLELIIKLIAYTPKYYFSDNWNRFDSVIIVACIAVIPFEGTSLARGPNVLRGLRLLKELTQFRLLTTQLLRSIVRIMHVFMLVVVVLFSFAVMGVEFFGQARYGTYLNESNNFTNIPNALLVLIRVTFSEWVYMRYDCSVSPPECTYGEDCGSVMSIPFFVILLLLNAYILANTFVAVVLTDFSWLYSSEVGVTVQGVSGLLSGKQMVQVQAAWKTLDHRGTGFVLEADLEALVKAIDPPLGFKGETLSRIQLEQLKLELSSFPMAHPGQVRFRDLLTVLSLNKLGREAIPQGHILESVAKPTRFKTVAKAVLNQIRVANYKAMPRRVHKESGKSEGLRDSISLQDYKKKLQEAGVLNTSSSSSSDAGKQESTLLRMEKMIAEMKATTPNLKQ